MGMYTLFIFGAEIKKDTPPEAIAVMRFLANPGNPLFELDLDNLPDHRLFKIDRWRWLGSMNSYSHAFRNGGRFNWDDITQSWFLELRSSIKNGGQIEAFTDWVMPYVDGLPGHEAYGDEPAKPGTFLGLHLYEETEIPTLIHYREDDS